MRAAGEQGLRAALDELERASTRPYYDAASDEADRTVYYDEIDAADEPSALYDSLSRLLDTTHAPRHAYHPAERVYPWVDLHPDRKLRGVYSGKTFEPEEFIRADFETEVRRAERLLELVGEAPASEQILAEQEALEDALPFNCEHVVPQSWFQKREPMRGDLHHLFACESGCNSFRGNTPYFDFADFEEVIRDECVKRDADRFEPSTGKGPAARAVLYFLLRYPNAIAVAEGVERVRLPLLLDWHATDPPQEYDQHRNQAIFEAQGNRNPLIDHSEWATQIDFVRGLGGGVA